MLTPSLVAKRLAVDIDTVRAWCSSGELRAINVARNPRGKRPRWRISEEDLAEFLARRTTSKQTAADATRPRRPRQKPRALIEFF